MKNVLLFLCLVFLAVPNAFSQPGEGDFDSLMRKVFEEDGPGGAALVVRDGEVLYRKAMGCSDSKERFQSCRIGGLFQG